MRLRLSSIISVVTLRINCQGLTLPPLLPSTVDTKYCNVVFIVCNKTRQIILCDTGIGDVQKSSIWCLGSIGFNDDEVEVCTVSTTQCPAHGDNHTSTDAFRNVDTGDADSGRI